MANEEKKTFLLWPSNCKGLHSWGFPCDSWMALERERDLTCLGAAAIKKKSKGREGEDCRRRGREKGVKGHRNKTGLAPSDRTCQVGTKKDLWKIVLEPESQTGVAQLLKILCLTIWDLLACLH